MASTFKIRKLKMKHDFTGKVALVTGGGSGIGRQVSESFAEAGASVIVIDVNSAAADSTASSIRSKGRTATAFACDLTNEHQVSAAIAFSLQEFGCLDFAFNNAGIAGKNVQTQDLEMSDWERIIAVNLTSVFLCMKHELKYFRKIGRGSIVNTSSTAGLRAAHSSGVAYAASKHGVIGLTKTAAKEYLSTGIRINAICPGAIGTPLLEQTIGAEKVAELARDKGGRLGAAEHIAEMVMWLSSPEAHSCNGQAILLDGGHSL